MTSVQARRNLFTGFLMAVLLSAGAIAQRDQGSGAPNPMRPAELLRFRYMGPASAGRISAAAGVPGDTTTYYAGAASGGIWKSNDGGKTFEPIFDDQPAQAVGALAVAPSDPRVVWAGTGEAWVIRDSDVMGDGVYRSTDAGGPWKNMGLTETGRIGRIIVHPSDPRIVYVCALGRATGPQEERGVYKTVDGGEKWDRVLFADANTGCSGLTIDAHDPNVLFAGMWQLELHTWAEFSGGPGSAVYVTRDAGATWKKLENGLPKAPVGKIDVAMAPSDSKRVYSLIQTASQGSLWRSDDGGNSWRVISWDRTLIGRAGYYIRLGISPTNPDEVMVASSSFHRSTDGGKTFPNVSFRGCGDCHDIWIDPKNPDHWVQTGDAGMGITTNHAESFTMVTLPIGQMYHVAVDNRVPYWIYSNRQDDGTMRGRSDSPVLVSSVPSYSGTSGVGSGGVGDTGRPRESRGVDEGPSATAHGGIGATPWQANLGGCESGFTLPDPVDPDIVWASCYGNEVTRFDNKTGRARSVSPWIHTLDSPPADNKYRCHWTPPLAIDPFDHNTMYYGCQVIFKTSNAGQTWTEISPDLSTRDPSRIVSSGGVVGDNLGQFYGEVVFAIAPSEIQQGLIWAGTNDGKLWYTKDGGGQWNDVTKNINGLPEWGTVRKIEPSHFDAGTAYVAIDFHLMDNRDPFIYKTTDFGEKWQKISDGLPAKHPLAYAMSIAENPNRKGMLFAGTGHAFFYSLDDGAHWTPFQEGLPAAPVTWIVVPKLFHDVVVSTYGRGLFILNDITRLEQADEVTSDDAFLYAPRSGFRLARGGMVDLLYSLKVGPKDPVKFEVLDNHAAVIRTIRADAGVGLNRLSWDLRHDAPKRVELRTTPPDNPEIWNEPRFKDKQTRPIVHWGIEQAMTAGPLATPGTYQIRMTVNERPFTRTVAVVQDSSIRSSETDLAASTLLQIRIRDDMNAAADMINRIEVMRKQIEDQAKANKGKPSAERALSALNQKMMNVELRLLSRTDLHSDDKWYVEAYKVYMNLVWLNGVVGTGAGDVAGGADYRPTDSSITVLEAIEKDLDVAKNDFAALVEKDVAAFNRTARGLGLKALSLEPPKTIETTGTR
jgi:photosystem II stability/assembly factor-like uncharacterized protein